MNPDLGDLHEGDPGIAGERMALETLKGFFDLDVPVVVIGGTALRILGSPVPSIDLDCLIPRTHWERYEVYDFIEQRTSPHKLAYEDSYLEVDLLEDPHNIWNSDKNFVPMELFARTGTQNIIGSLANESVEVEIPSSDALLFMKTKAMTEWAAQLRHAQDPVLRASLPADASEPIEGVPPGFFRRKAGKDLVDIAFLVGIGANPGSCGEIAESLQIRETIARGWEQTQEDLVEEATRLLARHSLPGDPAEVLEKIRDALESGSG